MATKYNQFGTMKCHICGKEISAGGAAKTSHFRSHVRKGEAKEKKGDNGRLEFIPTGKKKEKVEKVVGWWAAYNQPKRNVPPHKKVTAHFKEEVGKIECRNCQRASLSKVSNVDPRFLYINCNCGSTTFFPVRFARKNGTVIE